MAIRLKEVERAYFTRKVGGANPTEPLNSIKRRYMAETIGSGITPQTKLEELEKKWLLIVIGGAVTDWNSIEDLWRQAVISISQVPTNYLSENKIKFYINAP